MIIPLVILALLRFVIANEIVIHLLHNHHIMLMANILFLIF
jgi:hypothetical protein